MAITRRDIVAARLGGWAAAIVTAAGVVYGTGLVVLAVATDIRPTKLPDNVQFWAGVATFVVAQFLLVIVVCIHRTVHEHRRVLAQLAFAFTLLFTAMVSINRFVQLTVVRQATLSGRTEAVALFLPYSSTSVMFALEILGWGVFLGLAALALAPVFGDGKIEFGLRWVAVAYGGLEPGWRRGLCDGQSALHRRVSRLGMRALHLDRHAGALVRRDLRDSRRQLPRDG